MLFVLTLHFLLKKLETALCYMVKTVQYIYIIYMYMFYLALSFTCVCYDFEEVACQQYIYTTLFIDILCDIIIHYS